MSLRKILTKDDVLTLKKRLETTLKERDHTGTEDVLNALADCKVPAVLQTETRLNLIITKLTTNDNECISTKAKQIQRMWREGKSPVRTPPDSSKKKEKKSTKKALNSSSDSILAKKSLKSSNKDASLLRNSSPTVNTNASTGIANEQRTKITGLLKTALTSKEIPPECNFEGLASEIEEALWNRHMNDGEYINHYRSISYSIKDPMNGWLHASIVGGLISPQQLVDMNVTDLASEEAKSKRDAAIQTNIFDRGLSNDFEGETDLFTCGRCKKSRTTYKQLQTRSADEPMTSFIKCLECGNRWKQN